MGGHSECQPPNPEMSLRPEHPPPPTRQRDQEPDFFVLPGNMEHRPVEPTHQAPEEDHAPSETYSDEDDIPIDELEDLCTLADNSVEDWPNHRSHMIKHNLAETTSNTTHFANCAMVGYFTGRPPLLQDFKIWVREELERKSGWPIYHTQYLGKNFALFEFSDPAD